MFFIYCITNVVNGKKYVGFATDWKARKSSHISTALNDENTRYPLYQAMRKYGIQNFQWSILYQSNDRDFTLNIMEGYCIREQNSHAHDGHGYNLTYGGQGNFGWVPSEETKHKISQSKKGKSSWIKGLPNPWTAQRNRENAGKPRPNLEKIYKFIDPSGREFIEKGLTKFCKLHNLNPGNMCSVAAGKLNHYKHWKCEIIN